MPISNIKSLLRPVRRKIERKISFAVSASKLKNIDKKEIKSIPGEIRLFVKGRNESLRLPYFLDYYFSKGVDRVFLIDNNSTDDMSDIALAYKNVHVFRTEENFTNYSNWMEILLDKYGKGHWCIAADVDEILNYPNSDVLSIRDLSSFLDSQGETAMQCYLLDMYSDKAIQENFYKQGDDPLLSCPYFDIHFIEEEKIWKNERTQKPYLCNKITGNMRKRVFGADVSLSKISLFKYDHNVYMGRGVHSMDGVKFSDVRGVVFHFKYLQDFNDRVVVEAARGVYEGGAAAYKKYAGKVMQNSDLTCMYEGSVKFENNKQLIKLGLLKSNYRLDEFTGNVNTSYDDDAFNSELIMQNEYGTV